MKKGLRTIKTWKDFNSESKTNQEWLITYQSQSEQADRIYSSFKQIGFGVACVIGFQLMFPFMFPSSAADPWLTQIVKSAMQLISILISITFAMYGIFCLFLFRRKAQARRWMAEELGIDVSHINLYELGE